MKISRPSPSMVVAGIALFVSLGGTSMAAVNYASRAGSVDGKSAVYAGASLSQAAGKLVATNRSGADKGRLPGKFVADVGKTTVVQQRLRGRRQRARRAADRRDAQRPRHADRDLQRPERRPPATRTRSRRSRSTTRRARSSTSPAASATATARSTRRRQPDLDVDRHRRLEHVHVPHRAPLAERDHHTAACARTAAARPRPPASSSASSSRSCRSACRTARPRPQRGRWPIEARSPAGCRSGGSCSGSWSAAGRAGTRSAPWSRRRAARPGRPGSPSSASQTAAAHFARLPSPQ